MYVNKYLHGTYNRFFYSGYIRKNNWTNRIGLFQKKSKEGRLSTYFFENTHGIFRFPILPLETPDKIEASLLEIHNFIFNCRCAKYHNGRHIESLRKSCLFLVTSILKFLSNPTPYFTFRKYVIIICLCKYLNHCFLFFE